MSTPRKPDAYGLTSRFREQRGLPDDGISGVPLRRQKRAASDTPRPPMTPSEPVLTALQRRVNYDLRGDVVIRMRRDEWRALLAAQSPVRPVPVEGDPDFDATATDYRLGSPPFDRPDVSQEAVEYAALVAAVRDLAADAPTPEWAARLTQLADDSTWPARLPVQPVLSGLENLRVVSVITGPGPSVEGYIKADVQALFARRAATAPAAEGRPDCGTCGHTYVAHLLGVACCDCVGYTAPAADEGPDR